MLLTNLMGGIYRIDYLVLQQQMVASGITTNIKTVFGSYLVVSSVNKKDINSEDVYKILIDRQFPEQTLNIKFILMKLLKDQ